MKYKYIYIISLALSSFFTYKHLSANTYDHIHAFFIPNGAFIKNTQITEPKPQQQSNITSPQSIEEQSDNTDFQVSPQQQIESPIVSQPQTVSKNTTSKTDTSQPRPTNTHKNTIKTQHQTVASQKTTSNPTKQKKKNTYQLEAIPSTTSKNNQTKSTTTQSLPKPKPQKQNLAEQLDALPFPNFQDPKFKQLYGLYCLELRTLYKKRKLPSNITQNDILSKANSIRRFSVK